MSVFAVFERGAHDEMRRRPLDYMVAYIVVVYERVVRLGNGTRCGVLSSYTVSKIWKGETAERLPDVSQGCAFGQLATKH